MALKLASRQARLVVFGYNAVTSKIGWVRSPASPQYAGSPLSLAGGQVMAYYKDGTASDITASCGYDPDEGSLLEYAGELNINATYTDHAGNEFTADTQIDVADVEELFFTSIAKPTQKEGTALDVSGAVLSIRYTDGTTRSVDASSVTFEPAAGEILSHMDSLPVQAVWKNPATGSEYTAEYTVVIDQVEGIYFAHAPNKSHYAEGEPLDLTGATVAMKYKKSGDIVMVTPSCTFYPPSGEIMSPYAASIHATYQTAAGDQYEAETLVNVQTMTIPIDVIGQIIGEDLGLDFNDDLPSDFWDDFYPQDVPYIPADGDYYLPEDAYSSIVDYLNGKNAFASYEQYGDIPYMKLPAGRYVSGDGTSSLYSDADMYLIATVIKHDGRPEALMSPSCVDYPYTDAMAYNQVYLLIFTLDDSTPAKGNPGIKGSLNSASSGIVRKLAGLALPYVEDESMYTDYRTTEDGSIVNIPGILALPWCWYDDVPHDLSILRTIVQNGKHSSGCVGITHSGKVPYLTYSKESLYEEVKEQFPELFGSNVTYGDTTYVHVNA